MARITSMSSLWAREYKLETKPYDKLGSKIVKSSSKYSSKGGFDKGQAILIDPIILAVHEYIDLLEERVKIGAIGTDKDNVYVEVKGNKDGVIQLLTYNKENGSCTACNYNIEDKSCDVYDLRRPRNIKGERGRAIFLAILQVALDDKEALDTFIEYKDRKKENSKLDDVSIKFMATLCDNIYKRMLNKDIALDISDIAPLKKLNIEDVLSGDIAPTKLIIGKFSVFKFREEDKLNKSEQVIIKPNEFKLNLSKELSEYEKNQIIKLPSSHRVTKTERRVCEEIKRNWDKGDMKIANILLEGDAGSGKTQMAKALSYNLGLPYTKITCFSDMDKSDVVGSILPVTDNKKSDSDIEYKYFPSEIVRAFKEGYLLEIQEPTVIRDAAVLMILNSALEPNGTINLPTGVVHRHPDFVAVITTNRNYIGCRPLNEALRDRIQHSEKMDLPEKEVIVKRTMAKTGFDDIELTSKLADAIITLDECATANAIRGVAGMRSLFFWVDAIKNGADIRESMYHKVIYKMSTDPDEILLLEEAVENNTSLFVTTQMRR